jgi:predicted TIM-barrel fold metal-dependent hydrolase
LVASGHAYFEISMLEGIGGISNLLSRVPVDRILFGSHFHFFILEATVLKLRESNLLPAQVKSITRENTERLLRAL